MGTYDTRGGSPRHNPMFDADETCSGCSKTASECECPEDSQAEPNTTGDV
jgi:hypothetical protein